MTDPTTTNAPPAATEAPAAPAPVAPTQASPTENMSASEARRSIRQRMTAPQTETPSTPERDEQGRFASPSQDEAPAEPPAEEATPPEEESTGAPEGVPAGEAEAPDLSDDAGEETPATTVTIELRDGHPLREQGLERLDVPAEAEMAIRAALNYPVRRAELETAQTSLREQQTVAAQQKAEADFWYEKARLFATDPSFALQVQQLREDVGEDAARRFVAGALQEDMGALQDRVSEASKSVYEQHATEMAMQFVDSARTALTARYPGMSMDKVNSLIEGYGNRVQAGRYQTPHATTLFEMADEIFGKPEAYKPPETPEQMEARIRAQVEADMKAKADEAERKRQENARANPMGRMPSSAPVRNPGVPSPSANEDRPQTIHEARANLRRSARGFQR